MDLDLKEILEGLPLSAKDLAVLQRRWAEAGFSTQKLASAVDETPFMLKEWIAAWFEVELYLDTHHKKTDALTILGYLQCCADAVRNSAPTPSLAEEVSRMLKDFGMQRVQK